MEALTVRKLVEEFEDRALRTRQSERPVPLSPFQHLGAAAAQDGWVGGSTGPDVHGVAAESTRDRVVAKQPLAIVVNEPGLDR